MFLKYCEKRYRVILILIVFLSFAVSLTYAFYYKITPSIDAVAYDDFAWDIARGKGYDSSSSIGRPGPGYEFFLALIYYVFGHKYHVVWVIQSLLIAVMSWLSFSLARLVFAENWHPTMGLSAALLVGFSPDYIITAAMLMTDTLAVFLLFLVVFLFFKYIRSGSLFFLPLVAIVTALAALTRGNLLLIALPFLLYFIVKKEWKRGGLFLVILLIALTPWAVRNYRIYHIIQPFNAATGGLLSVGNHLGASGELEPNYKWPPEYDKMSQIDFDRAAGRDAVNFIKSHPFEFVRLSLVRLSVYFSLTRPYGWWSYLSGVSLAVTLALSAIYAAVVFILGFTGMLISKTRGLMQKQKPSFYFFLSFLMMPLSVAAIVVETRYRFPAYLFLSVFSGYAFYYLWTDFRRYAKPLLMVLLVLSINTFIDVWRNFDRIVQRFHKI